MKKIKLPLIGLLSAALLTIVFIGCKKDLKNPMLTSDASYTSDTTAGFVLVMDVLDVTGTPQADPNCAQNSVQVDANQWFKNKHVIPNVSAKDRISITIVSNETGDTVANYAPTVDANSTGLLTYCLPNGCYTISAHFSHSASANSVVNYNVAASVCFAGVDALCTYSQGYWFANNSAHPEGLHAWPNSINIGGFDYSNTDGIAIWNSSNQGGIPDAKKAFTQLAAVMLSGAANESAIANQVGTIQGWLGSLNQKLTSTYLPMEDSTSISHFGDARAAADSISNYIQKNECNGGQ